MVKFTVDKNKENPYVMLNKIPLSDDRISWRAKGIWAYLLSKPDNWIVREKDIMNKSTEGRDAVRGAIKELVDHGYILKVELRDKGKYLGVEYSVFEIPVEVEPSPEKPSTVETSSSVIPLPEKPSTVKPTTANPPHSNTNVTNKPINNKRTTTAIPEITLPSVQPELIVAVDPILKNSDDGKRSIGDMILSSITEPLPKGIAKKHVINLANDQKLNSKSKSEITTMINAGLKFVKNYNNTMNPPGLLIKAVMEGYDSPVEANLFAIQESKELEIKLVEKLEAVSSEPHEFTNPSFMQALIAKHGCISDMYGRANKLNVCQS